MNKTTKQIKELTGEDPVDMLGNDAEAIIEEFCDCNAKLLTDEEKRMKICRLCR